MFGIPTSVHFLAGNSEMLDQKRGPKQEITSLPLEAMLEQDVSDCESELLLSGGKTSIQK